MAKTFRWFILFLALAACTLAPAQDKDAEAARDQTLTLFKIFKQRDWKALYDVIAFSPTANKEPLGREVFASNFAKGLKDGDPDDSFGKLIDGMTDVAVGVAVVEKNFAYVTTTCKISANSVKVPFLGLVKLTKVGDAWKWDLTFSPDIQSATVKRFTELFGVPAKG